MGVVVVNERKEGERRYQIPRDHGRLTKYAKPDDGISAKNFHDLDDVIYQRERLGEGARRDVTR